MALIFGVSKQCGLSKSGVNYSLVPQPQIYERKGRRPFRAPPPPLVRSVLAVTA
jgi:hypothetical protein